MDRLPSLEASSAAYREVCDSTRRDRYFTARSYTMRETSLALGRSLVTLNKWIRDGIIPAPIYVESIRGYVVYLAQEVQVMHRAIALHERSFTYLGTGHNATIQRIWSGIESVRQTYER